jgi:hydrogenase expression/formation protein HypC
MCLAIPGKIISLDDHDPVMRTGKVNFGGAIKQVNLALTPEAKIDDYVIVHAGFAINIIDEKEALKVFEYIEEMEHLDSGQDQSR